jgi:hypothetical protein
LGLKVFGVSITCQCQRSTKSQPSWSVSRESLRSYFHNVRKNEARGQPRPCHLPISMPRRDRVTNEEAEPTTFCLQDRRPPPAFVAVCSHASFLTCQRWLHLHCVKTSANGAFYRPNSSILLHAAAFRPCRVILSGELSG